MRIQTETYGFAVQENCPLAHEPDWTLAFLTVSRWLTQKTLQDGKIITQFDSLLASGLEQNACVFIAVVTHHITQRMPVFFGVGLVEAPLQKHEREEDNRKPLFCRCVRLHPKVSQTSMRFDVEVIDLNGPALLINAQDLLCR